MKKKINMMQSINFDFSFLKLIKNKNHFLVLFFLTIVRTFLEVVSILSLIPIVEFFFINSNETFDFYYIQLTINQIIFSLFFIFLIKFCFQFFSTRLSIKISNFYRENWTLLAYNDLLNQPYSKYVKSNVNNKISLLINDIKVASQNFVRLNDIFYSFILFLFLLISTFFISPLFSLVCIIFFIINFIIVNFFKLNNSFNIGEKTIKNNRIITRNVISTLNSIVLIKINNLYHQANDLIRLSLKQYAKLQLVFESYTSLSLIVLEFIIIVPILIIIYIDVNHLTLIEKEDLSLFIFFIVSLSKFLSGYRLFTSSSRKINSSLPIYHKLIDLEFTDKAVAKLKKIKSINNIELQKVSFKADDKMIINDISLHLDKSSPVLIYGKSGSGKTTLGRIMSTIYTPSSGSILVNSFNIEVFDLASVRKRVSVYYNEIKGFYSKPIDYVITNNKYDKAKLDQLINTFELESVFLNNNNFQIDQLSSGELQRLNLATTFYKDADLYIIDEPTSNLNKELSTKIIQNIFKLTRNKLLVVISHDPDIQDIFAHKLFIR